MARFKRQDVAAHREVIEWSRIARIAYDGCQDAKAKGLHHTARQFQRYASRYYAEAMKRRLALLYKDES